jgi:hypothetical protein
MISLAGKYGERIRQNLRNCRETFPYRFGTSSFFVGNAIQDPNLMPVYRLSAVETTIKNVGTTEEESRFHLRFNKYPQQYLQQLEDQWLSD